MKKVEAMEEAPLEQATSAGFVHHRFRPKVGALLSKLRPYLIAVAGVAVASAIGAVASGAWGTIALLAFVVVVFSAAWYGGFGPSLFATALSFCVLAYYFLKPIGSLAIEEPVDRVIQSCSSSPAWGWARSSGHCARPTGDSTPSTAR